MSQLLCDLFGVEKPIVAMVHLAALPGRPTHAREAGMEPIVEAVGRDVEVLQGAGVDGLLFCNEADLPYQLRVGPEAAAAMAAVIGQVRGVIWRPFGVDLVWDPTASLAAARATGEELPAELAAMTNAKREGDLLPAHLVEQQREPGTHLLAWRDGRPALEGGN